MIKVICEGLKEAPKMNCTLKFRRKLVRGTLKYHDNIDVTMPMILKSGEMMTVNMHDMGNKSLTEMTDAINDTIRRANNSDMNQVMYEVSLDNTLTGLKKENLSRLLNDFTAQKCPVSIRCILFREAERRSITQFLRKTDLPSMILNKEQLRLQI